MRRKVRIITVILGILVGGAALAQATSSDSLAKRQAAEETQVQLPIKQLFLGMKSGDSSLVRSAFAPGSRLETITKDKEGRTMVKNTDLKQFFATIGSQPAGALDERLAGMEIKIDGEMATAWTPYEFWFKGQFSHRGVNAFQLVKLADDWKIWSIIDTRRK